MDAASATVLASLLSWLESLLAAPGRSPTMLCMRCESNGYTKANDYFKESVATQMFFGFELGPLVAPLLGRPKEFV